jgi:hypothetical protein
MHPEIDDFLENAFASVKPTSSSIGRVVVEPDYDVGPAADDGQQLGSELTELLNEQQVDSNALNSPDGFEVKIPSHYKLLSKYLRRITLHADSVEGDWVEVVPPGYWI